MLAVLLYYKLKKYAQSNSFLILIIFILIWFLAEFFSVRNKIEIPLHIFYGTRYGSWFLMGPLAYFYFRSITDKEWRFSSRQLWHFIPFVVFVVLVPMIAYKTLNDRQIDYGMLSVFDHREKVLLPIQWAYSVVFILQFLHLAFYLFKNLNLVNSYSKKLMLEYSNIELKIKWLRTFNITLIGVLVFSAIFLYIFLVTDIYRRHLDYIYVLPIGVLFYLLSFYLVKTDWQPTDKNLKKYEGSSLNPEQVPELVVKLDKLMQGEKMYLNNNLRLGDLAEAVGIGKHHLSQIINQHYGFSFYDFVNRFRVEEAKRLLLKHPDFTMIQVAFDCGFNNKTSFFNAFKKFESINPSKFREHNRS